MTSANPPIHAPRRELEPTHPCIRCGREGVPADAGLCELCNPLELSQPSATQMHGIAALGILVFIAVLAIAGRAVVAGTGPFDGQITAVTPARGGLAVTIVVSNAGTNAGSTTCRLTGSPPRPGVSESVQSPVIAPGKSESFTTVVTNFGTTPQTLNTNCGTR